MRRRTNTSGNAKLQGLTTQLDLTGHRYNIALVSAFNMCQFAWPDE